MRIEFSKMHGLGNDFIVINNVAKTVALTSAQIRCIANRRTGVGCDQVLLVEPPALSGADFAMRIFNADGSEAEQCGNGVRCFTVFLHSQRLVAKPEITIATAGGLVRSRLESREQVSVDMGIPRLAPADIPFVARERALSYSLTVADDIVSIGAVSMGNPHAVVRVLDVKSAPVQRLGPMIQRHERFPRGANVGFMEVMSPSHIGLRVFERGAGETPACGTGACAAMVVGREQGLLEDAVDVDLTGGRLHVAWRGGTSSVWMTGPATPVFKGVIEV